MPADLPEADLAAAKASLDLLVRRLRSLSPRSRSSRAGAVRAALEEFVALGARLESAPLKPPAVPEHTLADALSVVGGDVLEAIAASQDRVALDALTQSLSRALRATR